MLVSLKRGKIMNWKKIEISHYKKIALVAHDYKKNDLMEWAEYNRFLLLEHEIYATSTTGNILEEKFGFRVIKLQSGPLGGDQQLGAKIANGENYDMLIQDYDVYRKRNININD